MEQLPPMKQKCFVRRKKTASYAVFRAHRVKSGYQMKDINM